MPQFPFKEGEVILFQGASITDCRRLDDPAGLGFGYVAIVKGHMSAVAPGRHIEIINRGHGGDTTRELLARWQADCIDLHPTTLSIDIGLNGIWRQFFEGKTPVYLPEFISNYRRLIDLALKGGVTRLVLMGITPADSDFDHTVNRVCEEYSAVIRDLAREYNGTFVPTGEALVAAVKADPPAAKWLPDGVHPTLAGHGVIAAAWIRSLSL